METAVKETEQQLRQGGFALEEVLQQQTSVLSELQGFIKIAQLIQKLV